MCYLVRFKTIPKIICLAFLILIFCRKTLSKTVLTSVLYKIFNRALCREIIFCILIMIPEREDNILDLGLKLLRCYVTYSGVMYLFQAQKGQALPQR